MGCIGGISVSMIISDPGETPIRPLLQGQTPSLFSEKGTGGNAPEPGCRYGRALERTGRCGSGHGLHAVDDRAHSREHSLANCKLVPFSAHPLSTLLVTELVVAELEVSPLTWSLGYDRVGCCQQSALVVSGPTLSPHMGDGQPLSPAEIRHCSREAHQWFLFCRLLHLPKSKLCYYTGSSPRQTMIPAGHRLARSISWLVELLTARSFFWNICDSQQEDQPDTANHKVGKLTFQEKGGIFGDPFDGYGGQLGFFTNGFGNAGSARSFSKHVPTPPPTHPVRPDCDSSLKQFTAFMGERRCRTGTNY